MELVRKFFHSPGSPNIVSCMGYSRLEVVGLGSPEQHLDFLH